MEISYAELHRKLGINVAYYRKLKRINLNRISRNDTKAVHTLAS